MMDENTLFDVMTSPGGEIIHNALMENGRLKAEVSALRAELDALKAAQQWRPVTEDWPPYGVQYLGRAMLDSPTLLITRYVIEEEGGEVWQDSDGLLLYAGEIQFCAAIPPTPQERRPLPPAPNEAAEVQP